MPKPIDAVCRLRSRSRRARSMFRAWVATAVLATVVAVVSAPPVDAAFVPAPRSVGGEFIAGNRVRLSWVGSLPIGGSTPSVNYTILRGSTVIGHVPANPFTTANTFTTDVLPRGVHWFQVQAVDNSGTASVRTSPVRVVVWEGDTIAPHAVRNFSLTGVDLDSVQLRWNGAFDDLAVRSYTILDRGVVVADEIPDSLTPSIALQLPFGKHWLQIRAVDYAGNQSALSPPVFVETSPPAPTQPATAISAGFTHACAVLANETIKCWGDNRSGQLGDGTRVDSSVPVQVLGIDHAIAVSAGWIHTCALLAGGIVTCWGNAVTPDVPMPTVKTDIGPAVAISAGYRRTCALLADQTVACWGDGSVDPAPSNPLDWSAEPVTVVGSGSIPIRATAIDLGSGHACASLTDGSVRCWGWGIDDARLGTQSASGNIDGIDDAIGATVGSDHSCALRDSGTVACWRSDDRRDIATPPDSSFSPVDVPGVDGAVAIDAGRSYTCALLTGGTASCWGARHYDTPGIGIPAEPLAVVQGLASATMLSAGYEFACALKADGSVVCWGRNNRGNLGNGTLIPSSVPVPVIGL